MGLATLRGAENRGAEVDFFLRVILTSAIAALIVTIPALVDRIGMVQGYAVTFFAVFLVALGNYLAGREAWRRYLNALR